MQGRLVVSCKDAFLTLRKRYGYDDDTTLGEIESDLRFDGDLEEEDERDLSRDSSLCETI